MLRATLPRYLGASLVALGLDMGVFLLLLRWGMAPAGASALGYGLGVVAHWWLSAHVVFAVGAARRGPDRRRQQVLFVVSALAGLGITTGMVALGTAAGGDPRLAKLAAVGASFAATYVVRATLVFGQRRVA